MNFYQKLRNQRESERLSIEEAAERLHLSTQDYQDREDNRVHMNVPERCGLLVGLGMEFDDAVKLAAQPDMYSFGGPELASLAEKSHIDPFVRVTEDTFILVNRMHGGHEYTILKERVTSTESILEWVNHLCEKNWVTTEHLSLFIEHASAHIGVSIH